MKTRLLLLVPVLLLGLSGRASADDSPPEVEVVKLTLHAMPAPTPALKYKLLPTYQERRPGNAAVHYGKVTAEQLHFYANWKLQEKIHDLQKAPLDTLKDGTEAIDGALNMGGFSMLQRASRCDSCDWDHPIREGNAIAILLPDIQQVRMFARILSAKARIHIARGQFDEAIECFKINFALVRHAAQAPFLVSGLVGIACQDVATVQIETLIQQPGAPNLYWALSTLPRPLVDHRRAMETERYLAELTFPELRDLETQSHSPEEWNRILWAFADRYADASEGGNGGNLKNSKSAWRAALQGLILLGYPRAKQYLIDGGRKPAEVEAMPVAQVVLLYTKAFYEELRDDHFKDMLLPDGERRRALAPKPNPMEQYHREIISIAGMLLPENNAYSNAVLRSEQQIAALRILEAIRLYGASHQGKLPAKLSDITEVPVPNDPFTDQPFPYAVAGEIATLEVKTPHLPLRRYEIRLLPPK